MSALLLNRSYIPKTGLIGKPFRRAAPTYLSIDYDFDMDDGSTSKEERERDISFHQEAIRQLIERGVSKASHLTKVNINSQHH